MLACQRHLFSLPDDLHFLNCAQMSPLLKTVEQAGMEGIRRKSVPTRIQPADFFTDVERLRGLLARLIHASPEQVALIPSVSYGVALATHNVPLRTGQNVVLPGGEFPSNVYGWLERCHATGAELRTVPRPEAQDGAVAPLWNARLLEAMDDRTAVVSVTPLHWTDGTLFDLPAIGRRAREVGAWFIVDGTQAMGALPFDFQAVQPDLAVCAGYKWLLGPYQYGFAALGARMLEATPLEMNWISRAGSEDFTRLTDYHAGFQPGARRFDAGERSNFILVPMLAAAVEQLLAWGVEEVQAYCRMLARELEGHLLGSPYRMAPEGQRPGHLFGVRVPPGTPLPALVELLQRRNVHVSVRGDAIRVSTHVFNTPQDLQVLAQALLAVAAG